MHHQTGPLLAYTQVLMLRIIFGDGGGLQGVVSYGFEYGCTKADGWCMVTNIGTDLSCDMWTLPVILTAFECKQNAVQSHWRLMSHGFNQETYWLDCGATLTRFACTLPYNTF